MPKLLTTPFASEATSEYRTDVQNSTGAEPNSATYEQGFPPVTMEKIADGGKPPKGSDLNGVLYDITDNIVSLTKGARYGFNEAYATAIGGYPLGAVLRLDNGVEVESEVDSNSINPNMDMTGWKLAVSDNGVLTEDGETQRHWNNKFKELVSSNRAINLLWQGCLSEFPMGAGLNTSATQRIQIPCGVTHARKGFEVGTSILKAKKGFTVQRVVGNTSIAEHTSVINLTHQECVNVFNNETFTISTNIEKGGDFSGNCELIIIGSSEQEQPILSDSGYFSSGNIIIETKTLSNGLNIITVENLGNYKQVAILFAFSFIGTALESDSVNIQDIAITPTPHYIKPIFNYIEASSASKTRYQTTYPYLAPRGTATESGAIQMIAINSSANWSFAENIKFNPSFIITPQFMFQSPTSGTESRLLNKDTGSNINGLAFNLSDSGVSITNNAIVTAGHRFLCHWTAQSIF